MGRLFKKNSMLSISSQTNINLGKYSWDLRIQVSRLLSSTNDHTEWDMQILPELVTVQSGDTNQAVIIMTELNIKYY